MSATATTLPKLVKWWPAEAREAYEERAAIKEFDGRMPRDQAEREAETEVRQRWKAEALHAWCRENHRAGRKVARHAG